jgi:hypothetical protein
MHQPRPLDITEYGLDRIPSQRVAFAHITGTDQSNAQRLHLPFLLTSSPDVSDFWNI